MQDQEIGTTEGEDEDTLEIADPDGDDDEGDES